MLGVYMCITIQTLWKQGKNKTEISRLTNHDWKTIDKIVRAIDEGKTRPDQKQRKSLLDPYLDRVLELIEQGLSSVRIHEILNAEGCPAAYPTVKRYVGRMKKKEKICIRFHTPPGEEAQVDFGYLGKTPDDHGKLRKTWVFNMRLSYSRLDYYEKVYDQSVATFIRCHIHAFSYFEGVPKYVKIDNLKAAILEANFYEPIFQEQYKRFADHYHFNPIPCRVRQPQEKGKTESGIKYIKNNFLAGRTFSSGSDLDQQMRNWLDHYCNTRVHGTTRKVPQKLFEEKEKKELTSLPKDPFEITLFSKRKVYQDCHIYIDYNYYSVPSKYVGKEVEIEKKEETIRIYHQGEEIALHLKPKGKGEFITAPQHYPRYREITGTEYQENYRIKMEAIGPGAKEYFFHLLETCPRNWNRPVQGILSLKKSYPKKVIDLSCQRALHFEATGYRVIRNICENGSYQLPLEKEGKR